MLFICVLCGLDEVIHQRGSGHGEAGLLARTVRMAAGRTMQCDGVECASADCPPRRQCRGTGATGLASCQHMHERRRKMPHLRPPDEMRMKDGAEGNTSSGVK
jgi:hypothetical protein